MHLIVVLKTRELCTVSFIPNSLVPNFFLSIFKKIVVNFWGSIPLTILLKNIREDWKELRPYWTVKNPFRIVYHTDCCERKLDQTASFSCVIATVGSVFKHSYQTRRKTNRGAFFLEPQIFRELWTCLKLSNVLKCTFWICTFIGTLVPAGLSSLSPL